MVCCIIAAYLYASMVAVLRRWGIYWGLVRRGTYDAAVPTLWDNLRGRGPAPAFSTVVVTLLILSIAGAWSSGALHKPDSGSISTQESRIPRLAELVGF
ncbi:hypothetical protein [Croceicoccus bisphenolivorans]|uniref:hypothetical protein n=1 Tax=Croceicoccus bisphenolivorans TaxID=1783232 RepID=UPI00082FE6E1|nr:hypothetical protein [Croceicoccus bisphenolivorans]